MVDCTVTIEILYNLCSKMAVLIGETEKLILGGGFETSEDQHAYLLNSHAYYGLVNRIYKTRIDELPLKLKVPCKYELYAVLQALAISIGAMTEQELQPDENDRFYDPEWIKELASILREHYRETAAKNNCLLP